MHPAFNALSIHLESGHELSVDSIHITQTYGGLLEGYPNEALNNETLESAKKLMEGCWGARKMHTIHPPVRQEAGHPFLPPWLCMAWLTCLDPINSDFMGSELVIIWFAHDVQTQPLAQQISNAVRFLD